MTLFKNKYRVETTRLQNWDYGSNAPYFITICTANKDHFFGEVSSGQMVLNDVGIIAQNEWLKTPGIRPDMNLTLEEYVVMPNHFHAIIYIGENAYNDINNHSRDAMHRVSTADNTNSTNTNNYYHNVFGPQSKSIGSIVRGFKSTVSKQVRKFVPHFGWQERYHDHIIRNAASYLQIRQYILNNPANWQANRFYLPVISIG